MTTATMEFDLTCVDRLPPMPAVVADLIRSFVEDDIGTEEVADKISRDAALSVRLLKVVNSPFYGLSRQIASLSEAVLILGFSTVRSLALGASFVQRLPQAPNGAIVPALIWRHSLYTALCARRLAKYAGADRDWAFTAGLLHDVGKLVMYSAQPGLAAQVQASCAETMLSAHEAERQVCGVDHAEVGARVLAHWRLPASIERAAAEHHTGGPDGADPLSDIVHLADIIAHAADEGSYEKGLDRIGPTGAFCRLGLQEGACQAAFGDLAEEFETMRGLLGRD